VKNRFRPVVLALILIVVFVIAGCGPAGEGGSQPASSQESGESEPAASPAPAPTHLQASIVFVTGDVTILSGEEERVADIGATLEPQDAVDVAADSYCEIQFGTMSVVRVDADTQVTIASLSPAGEPDGAAVSLSGGTVVSKVRKLAGGEKFQVRTHGVTCGVRGTVFSVSSAQTGDMTLSVSEGAVAVAPETVDVDELKNTASELGTDAQQAAAQVEASLPLVEAGYSVTVTPQQSKHMEEQVTPVVQKINQAAATPEAERAPLIQEAGQAATQAAQTLKVSVPAPAPLANEKTKQALEQAATMELRPIETLPSQSLAPETSETSVSAADEGAPARAPGASQPQQGVSKNGTDGQEQVESAGEPVEPEKQEVQAPVQAQPQVASLPEQPQKAALSVTVSPADARLSVDGSPVSTPFTGQFEIGKSVSVQASRPGFASQRTRQVVAASGSNLRIRLDPKPLEHTVRLSSQPLVGVTSGPGGTMYVSDRAGTVYAVGHDGKVLWSVKSANSPAERNVPVVTDSYVFFSGSREFVTIDRTSGKVVRRDQLGSSSTHPFGQRVAFAKDLVFYPDARGIRVLKPESSQGGNIPIPALQVTDGQEGGTIPIPGGVRMTPTIYGQKLLVVSQKGEFFQVDIQSGKTDAALQTDALQPVGLAITLLRQTAVFAGRKGTVVAVDLRGPEILWQHVPAQELAVFSDILATPQGAFFEAGGSIHALSWSDGSELYAPIPGAASPPAYRDGMLIYTGVDKRLHLGNAGTGRDIVSFPLDAESSVRPAVAGERVAVANSTGTLLLLNATGLRATGSGQ